MRNSLRSLFALTLGVAALLMGVCGRAQAGYVPPLSLASRPSTSLFTDGAAQADADEGVSTAAAADPNPDLDRRSDDAKELQRLLCALPAAPPDAGAFSSGAGSPNAPGASGAAGSGPATAAAARPPTDAPTLVGVLFLETASHMPPPFPSRLFRPPRLFRMVVS